MILTYRQWENQVAHSLAELGECTLVEVRRDCPTLLSEYAWWTYVLAEFEAGNDLPTRSLRELNDDRRWSLSRTRRAIGDPESLARIRRAWSE